MTTILKQGMHHRGMLIVRMQAWAYDNVINKHYPRANAIAEASLRWFEVHADGPAPGFWANRAFDNFKEDCQANNLTSL